MKLEKGEEEMYVTILRVCLVSDAFQFDKRGNVSPVRSSGLRTVLSIILGNNDIFNRTTVKKKRERSKGVKRTERKR